MINKDKILAIMISAFIFEGCFNPTNIEFDVGIPSKTTIGENTFGCKINRISWRTQNEFGPYTNSSHKVEESKFIYDRKKDSTTIIIMGACFRHLPKAYEKLSFQFKSKGIPKQDFTYVLGKNVIINFNHFMENNLSNISTTNKFENLENNQVIFTRVDTTNKIVAGSFQGELVNLNKDKSNITEGRFDVLLKKIQYQ